MPIRTRLLGFAFATADLLVELAPDGRVMMAIGSGPAAGVGPATYQGKPLAGHLAKASGKALAGALAALKPGVRVGPVEILMTCGQGKVRRASLRAFMLPDLAPNASCSINYEGPAYQLNTGDAPPVMTVEAFLARAREILGGPDGGDLAIAFVDVAGLSAAGEGAEQLTARVEATLQSASVDDCSAARLTSERYALLRDRKDTRDIAGEIRELAREEGLDLAIGNAQAALTGAPLNALRALRFAVEGCLKDGGLERPDLAFGAALERTLQDAEAFRAVVKDRSFALYYQPVVDLRTGAVRHFEALSRFDIDGSPAAIIRMAEELALIEGFDLAVAEKAMQRLGKPGSGLLRIAINASDASMAGDAYVQALLRMTAAAPDERRRLIVEVSESAIRADVEAVNRRLGALRDAGIKLCIDDFGADAASFDYLRDLAVDTVKIDGRFIGALEADPASRALVTHFVDLCGSLKLTTIAERVETETTADILRNLRVDYGQGWLYGRAEPEPRTILPSSTPVRRRGAVEAWG